MSKVTRTRERLARLWEDIGRKMGMAWWEAEFVYSTDRKRFRRRGNGECVMICYADWRYGRFTLDINVKRVAELDDATLESYFIHEMMHVLVNEMRQKEDTLAHEERVVTGLTKAFEWLRETK